MAEAPTPTPTLKDAEALGLTKHEYQLIAEKQGRPPNVVELAMYSLLWSEHCAYKHSKRLLRTLPTEGPAVVLGPGENAGAIDIGDGLLCAFKVESHNHPSAVEPFQGAATGVGGILRDIFALGARPIAVLDSLRFGEPRDARSRYLLKGAVSGIAHYGNSVGVPTIGGEVYFEGPYQQSCIVNAMALGVVERDSLIRSAAAGPGNLIVLFGATTGRDGIGGASVLASAELGEGDDGAKRPTVQVGDPFEGKKLLECSLQLLEEGLLVSLQDLGAAGLASSAAEMAAKGQVGVDIDVEKVPLRERDLQPFEIVVSESQERMLCVVKPDNLEQALRICKEWDVEGAHIGTVTDSRHVRIFSGDHLLGDMPVAALVDEAPLYDIQPQAPTEQIYPAPFKYLSGEATATQALISLLASPNISSKASLYQHYDPIVQSRTVRRPGSADAAVLAIQPLSARSGDAPLPGLAVSIDCNGRRVAADPYRGTVEAVLECAANLACVGAEPLGATNNLNFGNPEKPHIAWQLNEAVRGLGDACRALKVPIVGGNVSLYNESASGPIYPTPVIGMVGRLPDVRRAGGLAFLREGDAIAIAGPFSPSLAASELSKLEGLPLPTSLPHLEFPDADAAIVAVREAARCGSLSCAHDIAEGGIAVALAECCLAGGIGAKVSLKGDTWEATSLAPRGAGAVQPAISPVTALFGEGPGGFLLSGGEDDLRQLAQHTSLRLIGTVGGESILIAFDGGEIDLPLDEARRAHSALDGLFE